MKSKNHYYFLLAISAILLLFVFTAMYTYNKDINGGGSTTSQTTAPQTENSTTNNTTNPGNTGSTQGTSQNSTGITTENPTTANPLGGMQ